VKKPVEKLLVAVNQGIQLMGKGKYHMKIGCVNNLRPAPVHPDFFQHSLAVRAVTVTTGVVMDFHMSAVGTLAEVSAKLSVLAV
jgi:hypothetical protein